MGHADYTRPESSLVGSSKYRQKPVAFPQLRSLSVEPSFASLAEATLKPGFLLLHRIANYEYRSVESLAGFLEYRNMTCGPDMDCW
jgi:hypothetical protein